MNIAEIECQVLHYFGKDRSALKERLLNYEFSGKEYRRWKKILKEFTPKPFDLAFGIFEDVSDRLINKEYDDIDWDWLGDLSWNIRFVLNPGIERVYDFDKALAKKCGGTVRIAEVYVSDVLPLFVVDTYYMTYDGKQNFWEIGPLTSTEKEKEFVVSIKRFLKAQGFTFLSKTTSLRKIQGLASDCNEDDASLFDVLFTDTKGYRDFIHRFNDKMIVEKSGKKTSWTEYYDRSHRLKFRHEYSYYPSKNVSLVVTDRDGEITEVKVWRDIGTFAHKEFHLDILAEHKKGIAKTGSSPK